MPKAVSVPSGEISVILPPTSSPSRRASRSPTAMLVVAELGRASRRRCGRRSACAGADVLGTDAAHQRAGGAGIGWSP